MGPTGVVVQVSHLGVKMQCVVDINHWVF
jgi:hypothetical protein